MSADLDKLTTEELEAALEKRRLEAMSKGQLIEELKKVKQNPTDRPEQLHQDLLKLADRFGYDVNEGVKTQQVAFNIQVLLLKTLSLISAVLTIILVISTWRNNSSYLNLTIFEKAIGSSFFGLCGLLVTYVFYWMAQKTWVINRKKFDGRNVLNKVQ